MNPTILPTVLVAVLLAVTVFGLLLGLGRRTNKALARLVSVAIAAAIAFFISGSLVSSVDPATLEAALATVPEGSEILAQVPSLLLLVQDLIRPILFVLLFLVLSAVLWIVYAIVSAILLRSKGKKKPSALLGGLVGAVQGFLVAAIILSPVLGYVHLASTTLAEYNPKNEDSAATVAIIREQYIDPVEKNELLSATSEVSALFFNATSAITVGEGTTLEHELPILLNAYDTGAALVAVPMEEFGESEKAAVRRLADLFADSKLLPTVSAELLSAAATEWDKGEDFLGLAPPTVEGELAPIVHAMIGILADSTAESLKRDLDTVAEFFILMIDYDMTALASGEGDALARVMEVNPTTGKSFIGAAVALLDENPHLSPLRASITEMGATLIAKQFGTPEELRENYGEMVGSVVETLKDIPGETNEEKVEAITPHIKEELAANDIHVSDEVVDEASRFLLEELEKQDIAIENLTEEDIFGILDKLAAGEVTLP